jgi:hypothetical protein
MDTAGNLRRRLQTVMAYNPYTPPKNVDHRPSNGKWLWIGSQVIAVGIIPFMTLPLIITLPILAMCHVIAVINFLIRGQPTRAKVACLASLLLGAAWIFTDWGFSSPRQQIRVSWGWLIPACMAHAAVILSPVWTTRNGEP